MAPEGSWASSEGNRRSMLANRGRDTKPEKAIRSLVHAAGLRYRVSARPVAAVRRSADLVFGPTKVAVFVDGCFWHKCPEHFTVPRRNNEFWMNKIDGNVRRDRETDRLLEAEGWAVLRFWEHEAPEDCSGVIVETVRGRRNAARTPGNAVQ
ncbi:very short patch repair endonuclease [Yinghuangia seranimata]|nr:very short patch repair endonuclease [Yinghuangia seranimata]MDI2130877.1 very short patch repair endonuclease [Yinghuangia seranimata]